MKVMIDEAMQASVLLDAVGPVAGMAVDTGMDVGVDDGMWMEDPMMGMETEVKDPLLSNWFFVGGMSAGVLILGVVAGLLLAKWKIKKGIDLYED